MFFWGSNKHRNQWWASKRWKILSDIFNKHYVKVVEKSSGTKPSSLGDSRNLLLDETMIGKVIDTYRDHPGVITIKSSVTQKSMFSL